MLPVLRSPRFPNGFVTAVLERLLVLLAGLLQAQPTRFLATGIAAVTLAVKTGPADEERVSAPGPPALHLDEDQSQYTARPGEGPWAIKGRPPMLKVQDACDACGHTAALSPRPRCSLVWSAEGPVRQHRALTGY